MNMPASRQPYNTIRGKAPEDARCFHKGVELGDEYPSEGDNLVGEMVECVWQAIRCSECKVDKIFVKGYKLGTEVKGVE